MKKIKTIRMKRRSDGYIHDVEVEIKQEKVGRTWKDSQKSNEKVWKTICQPDWDMVSIRETKEK